MTVLVATPSWNRRAILTQTAAALAASDRRPADTDYLVTDDASTEYSEEDLKALFPWARIVRHATKHRHPLLNTMFCFTEFLNGTYDHLVILDSDMIVSPDWRVKLDELVKTPGFRIGSLYHSNSHKVTATHPTYYVKETAGFAGMVFTREIMTHIRNKLGPVHNDWAVCDLMGRKDFFVCKPSAVAHIGINGQWNGSSYAQIDKAVDFDWAGIDPSIKQACETLLKVKFG
jgi:hypothetical protein